jgi:uncharacterized membrane protein
LLNKAGVSRATLTCSLQIEQGVHIEHKRETDNAGAMKSKANIALIIFLLIGAYFTAAMDMGSRVE